MFSNLSMIDSDERAVVRRQYLMLIDNSESLWPVLRESAAMLGIRNAKAFRDPALALKSTTNGPAPDMILLNWNGRRNDPIAFCSLVRSPESFPYPFVPLIMASANATKAKVLKARDAGVDEFLVCPFSPKALYERIHSVLFDRRGFVAVKGYFGPDRRRGAMARWLGADRRTGVTTLIDPSSEKIYIG